MAIEVMLDIFSGRPNPTFTLDSAPEGEFLSRLESLPPSPAAGSVAEATGLGYRGFIVHGEALPEPVRVYRGMAWRAGRRYQDHGRELERWLMQMAGSSLDANLTAVVERDFERD